MIKAKIEPLRDGVVRLRWWHENPAGERFSPNMHADFDRCKIRGLTPEESALAFCRSVLSAEVTP
jgi:hypothetical protein